MTEAADIKLLPSSVAAFTEALKAGRGSLDAWLEVNDEHEVAAHIEAYARANVERAVAPLQAEIEALRAEVSEAAKVLRGALDARTDGEPLRVLANRASNALYWRTESAERAKARAERLAEALRHQRWCRTCAEDGWESCEEGRKNDALLRDQEEGHE